MSYVVRAINRDGATGAFTLKKETLGEAMELAKRLRESGMWVIVTSLDGKTIAPDKNPAQSS